MTYPPNVYHKISLATVSALLAAVFVLVTAAGAHETRPAYLEIRETSPGLYSVLWRTPVLSGMRLPVLVIHFYCLS